jgi:hypothetical protein
MLGSSNWPHYIACLRRDRVAVHRIEVRDRRRAGDQNIAAGRAVGLHHLRIQQHPNARARHRPPSSLKLLTAVGETANIGRQA